MEFQFTGNRDLMRSRLSTQLYLSEAGLQESNTVGAQEDYLPHQTQWMHRGWVTLSQVDTPQGGGITTLINNQVCPDIMLLYLELPSLFIPCCIYSFAVDFIDRIRIAEDCSTVIDSTSLVQL